LGFEVLFEGDGKAFKEWLEPYAEELGAQILVSDDNDSYSVAAAELSLSHQLCIAHVRKYVKRRAESILEQAEVEWGKEDEKYKKLEEELKRLKRLLEELPEEGGTDSSRLGGCTEGTCGRNLRGSKKGKQGRKRRPVPATGCGC
jgi:hypothetical protein